MTANVTDAEVQKAYEEALDDVHTRFLLNLPPEELATSDRILFQLEQAFWFYDDFICDNSSLPLPRFKSLKPFAQRMFSMSPLLNEAQFPSMWAEFSAYKQQISTYGTILMNNACNKVILCQVWKGNSWTFPAGKVNQNELGTDAGARETYEETGFDPNCNLGLTAQMKELNQVTWDELQEDDALTYTDGGKRRTMYVCRGVPDNFPFAPVARKEVSKVSWHRIDDLPKRSYAVLPFMKQLRKWIKKRGSSRKSKGGGSASGNNSKNSTPKRRSSSSKKPRSRTNSRGRVREDDTLLESGLASPGDVNGWSEDDMFKINESLIGRKVTYDGNPHQFAEKGFDGQDPHQFKVVGGGFMNSVKGLAPPPETSRLQPLFRRDDSEDGGLTPFFSDEGVTPWGEEVVQAAGLSPQRVNQNADSIGVIDTPQDSIRPDPNSAMPIAVSGDVATDSIFLTDVEITNRSQREKVAGTMESVAVTEEPEPAPISTSQTDMVAIRLQLADNQRRYENNLADIERWVANLPKPPPTKRFGEFKLDKNAIKAAMQQHL